MNIAFAMDSGRIDGAAVLWVASAMIAAGTRGISHATVHIAAFARAAVIDANARLNPWSLEIRQRRRKGPATRWLRKEIPWLRAVGLGLLATTGS